MVTVKLYAVYKWECPKCHHENFGDREDTGKCENCGDMFRLDLSDCGYID